MFSERVRTWAEMGGGSNRAAQATGKRKREKGGWVVSSDVSLPPTPSGRQPGSGLQSPRTTRYSLKPGCDDLDATAVTVLTPRRSQPEAHRSRAARMYSPADQQRQVPQDPGAAPSRERTQQEVRPTLLIFRFRPKASRLLPQSRTPCYAPLAACACGLRSEVAFLLVPPPVVRQR